VGGQEQQDRQGKDGGDSELRAYGEMLVDVLAGGTARRAPSLDDRPCALPADQVFTAHRNPFPLARGPTLVLM
jgi:hypothetical protein